MKDIRITREGGSWDLKMENGDLQMVEDGAQAAQHSTIRLMIFKGELALDGALVGRLSLGTKFYEIIFDSSKSRAEKELEIKRRLLGTPGIDGITKWTWTQTGGSVSVDAEGKTAWGTVDLSQDIEVL